MFCIDRCVTVLSITEDRIHLISGAIVYSAAVDTRPSSGYDIEKEYPGFTVSGGIL